MECFLGGLSIYWWVLRRNIFVGTWWRLSNRKVFVITEVSVYTNPNFSFLGFGFVGNSTPTHMIEKGCSFFVCIAWELVVHAAVGGVTSNSMSVALYDGLSILIISLSVTVLHGGFFGLRRCGIFTLFLLLDFCAVGFSHQFVYFGSKVLIF